MEPIEIPIPRNRRISSSSRSFPPLPERTPLRQIASLRENIRFGVGCRAERVRALKLEKFMFPYDRFRTAAAAETVATALFLAVPAHAGDAHGSIAFGRDAQGKSVAYGFAWNHAAGDEARASALNACLSSGGKDCAELASFRNGCGALALDRHGMAQGKSGMSREQAEARALRTCEAAGGSGCAVVGSQCASPGERAGTWSGSEGVLAARDRPEDRTAAAEGQRDAALTRDERIAVQRGLAALGFDAGLADGMFGPRSRTAIRAWQRAKGLEGTGYVTRDEALALADAGAEAPKQPDRDSKIKGSGGVDVKWVELGRHARARCVYRETPGIWSIRYNSSRNNVKLCLGRVDCDYRDEKDGTNHKFRDLALLCFTKNGECPSPSRCFAYERDIDVKSSKAQENAVVPGGLGGDATYTR